jgi:hypothetical protein
MHVPLLIQQPLFMDYVEHRDMVILRILRCPTTQLPRIPGVNVRIKMQNSKTVQSLQ